LFIIKVTDTRVILEVAQNIHERMAVLVDELNSLPVERGTIYYAALIPITPCLCFLIGAHLEDPPVAKSGSH